MEPCGLVFHIFKLTGCADEVRCFLAATTRRETLTNFLAILHFQFCSCEHRERLGSADEQRPRGAAHVLDERRANAFIVSRDPPYSSALAVSEAGEGHSGDPFWCVRSIGQCSAKGVC